MKNCFKLSFKNEHQKTYFARTRSNFSTCVRRKLGHSVPRRLVFVFFFQRVSNENTLVTWIMYGSVDLALLPRHELLVGISLICRMFKSHSATSDLKCSMHWSRDLCNLSRKMIPVAYLPVSGRSMLCSFLKQSV